MIHSRFRQSPAALFVVMVLAALLQPSGFAQDRNYLPLSPGAQWELRSTAVAQPMLFTAHPATGQAYSVDWQNPWVKATFVFRVSGERVLLEGLDMGNGVAPIPQGNVYFNFHAKKGGRWSNVAGTFTMVDDDLKITTPAGTFVHCVEIAASDAHGNKTFWFFAPNIGFVQFGEGGGAFQLTHYTGDSASTAPVAPTPPTPTPVATPTGSSLSRRIGGLYLGLESNPTPTQGFSFAARSESQLMSAKAGSRLIFVGPKWSEIEPTPGNYVFNDVDDRIRLAEQTGSAVLLNLRVIDTSNNTIPARYAGWAWDDPRLIAKLEDALHALAPHLKGHARWVTVGNEVDTYFGSHPKEIAPYAHMMAVLLPDLHRTFRDVPVGVNFTTSAVKDLRGKLSGIVKSTEIDSLNYYPINADFTFRDPSGVGHELETIIAQATGRPIVFQEMGYPSSTRLGSSEDKQAAFLSACLQVLAKNSHRVQAASFNWRSDLPDAVVNQLTGYYQLANSDNFREFLATLGWFHQDNTPKKVWSTFTQQAPKFLPAP